MAKKPVMVVPNAIKEMEQYLPDRVIKAIAQVDSSFDSQKLLEAIIHHFGGPEKFAFQIVQEFKAAGPGTLVRQRILEMVNRLTMNVSASSPPSKNAGDMDDDELFEAAGQVVSVVIRKEKLRAPQATDQDPGPAPAVGLPPPQPKVAPNPKRIGTHKQANPRGRPRLK